MKKLGPETSRAARALLNWSMRDLASYSGVALSTINLLEKGNSIRPSTEEKILSTLNRAGVTIQGDGEPTVGLGVSISRVHRSSLTGPSKVLEIETRTKPSKEDSKEN